MTTPHLNDSAGELENTPEPPQCSAKGCRADATHAVRWNNPKIHTPERLKIWVACPDHLESLSEFLKLRGFLRDKVPLSALGGTPE